MPPVHICPSCDQPHATLLQCSIGFRCYTCAPKSERKIVPTVGTGWKANAVEPKALEPNPMPSEVELLLAATQKREGFRSLRISADT